MRPFFFLLATHLLHAQFAKNVTAYIAYVSEESLSDISRVIQRRASRHPPHTRCIPLTSAYHVHRPHLRASCISGTTTLSNKTRAATERFSCDISIYSANEKFPKFYGDAFNSWKQFLIIYFINVYLNIIVKIVKIEFSLYIYYTKLLYKI